MPLHLLGKKSWNVYNPANIARVKKDEAEALARQEAQDKRQQDLDAERRLAILRGESPPPLPVPAEEEPSQSHAHEKRPRDQLRDHDAPRDRRKRKRFGEDDTDFEMRIARDRADASHHPASTALRPPNASKTSNAPLVNKHGHIALFPEDDVPRGKKKNEEAELESAAKRREFEDQYTMRFSNAAGKGGVGVTDSGPWYASKDVRSVVENMGPALQPPGKDVWGKDDPKRRNRDAARVIANDPLALMKRGAAKVRDVERERRALNEEKAREADQLRKDEQRRGRMHRQRSDVDELEQFTPDPSARQTHHERRHRDRRSRSPHRDERDRHHCRRSLDRHHEHRHRYRHHGKSSHNGDPRDPAHSYRGGSTDSRRALAKTDHY
ncbi:hypothetical protein F5Y18DRAFT_99329 [Xylariaceae sp. FL1019]|nr:hypothetical protein F5Y18DRAFT_99329 [Xylariaceae sp. FL1019]